MNRFAATVLIAALAGCASGTSRLESLAKATNPVDAAALVAVAVVVYNLGNGSVWEAATSSAGDNRYRIVLKQSPFATTGDGEAGRLFKQHARNLTAAQSCQDYRILEYEERMDAHLVGAQRVAEGVIECVKA